MAKPAKKVKKKDPAAVERSRNNMKLVTSQTCAVCKQQCQRGLKYLEKMSEPGAIGYGVPCILTRGKG
ncbi:MAG: hypothetical protein ACM32O_13805 [Clostridia bacterium]